MTTKLFLAKVRQMKGKPNKGVQTSSKNNLSPCRRSGVGRPRGTGKWGCDTKPVRIPAHLIDDVMKFVARKMK